MSAIQPLVPSEVCRTCDGCCRYAERDSVWSPLFLFEEIVELTRNNIVPTCLFTHPANKAGRPARIDLVEEDGRIFCPCLSRSGNTCRIYAHRPLDCRLYPFLLVRRAAQAYLAIDEKCPYIQKNSASDEVRDYAKSLSAFFKSSEMIQVLRANPEIIQAYPGDFRILELLF